MMSITMRSNGVCYYGDVMVSVTMESNIRYYGCVGSVCYYGYVGSVCYYGYVGSVCYYGYVGSVCYYGDVGSVCYYGDVYYRLVFSPSRYTSHSQPDGKRCGGFSEMGKW